VASRFKIDENLPDEIADLFIRHGHDAVTVADQGWRGMADDDLRQGIQDESRWLVTAGQGVCRSAKSSAGDACGRHSAAIAGSEPTRVFGACAKSD
jgi:hypothetical protein